MYLFLAVACLIAFAVRSHLLACNVGCKDVGMLISRSKIKQNFSGIFSTNMHFNVSCCRSDCPLCQIAM